MTAAQILQQIKRERISLNALDDGGWEASIEWETALGGLKQVSQWGDTPRQAVELLVSIVLENDEATEEIEEKYMPRWLM